MRRFLPHYAAGHECARCGESIERRTIYRRVLRPRSSRLYYTPIQPQEDAPAPTLRGWVLMEAVWRPKDTPEKQLYRRVTLEPGEWRGEEYHHHCLLEELRERARLKREKGAIPCAA